MESYIGKKLFQRTTRHVHLTEAGELYLNYARSIIANEQESKNAISEIETEPHGTITIGMPSRLNSVFIAKSLALFLERYPKIKCRIIAANSPASVIENAADVVITTIKTTDNQLIQECLFTAPVGIYASPDYIKKYGAPKNLQELAQHNCLINLCFTPDKIWKFKEGKKVQVGGNYECCLGSDILIGAMNGIGLAYFIKVLVQKEMDAQKLIEIPLDYEPHPVSIYIYHRPVPNCSIIRLLVKHLLQTMLSNDDNGTPQGVQQCLGNGLELLDAR